MVKNKGKIVGFVRVGGLKLAELTELSDSMIDQIVM